MIRSLGIVVRPNVAPDIRPQARQFPAQPEEDEAEVSIAGKRGQCINLASSQNYSASFTQKQAEQYRLFDRVWVTNPKKVPVQFRSWPRLVEPTGLKNYVVIEVMHYIQYVSSLGQLIVEKFRKPGHRPSEGIFVVAENIKRANNQ